MHDSETQCWVSRKQPCEQLPVSLRGAAFDLAPGTAIDSNALGWDAA